MPPLPGLDLGVAGLVYALSAAGFLTIASCRGHLYPYNWSDCPVIMLRGTRERVDLLEAMLAPFSCGYTLDEAHPGLLCVAGSSIIGFQSLAQTILIVSMTSTNCPAQLGPNSVGLTTEDQNCLRSCPAMALPRGIGTAFPIWRAIAVFDPTNLWSKGNP